MRKRYAPQQYPHHIVHRGNDRCPVFLTHEHRTCYLACLAHASRKYQCNVHAYVLMTNHVHLLATAAVDGGLSRMMQWLGARYTSAFNADTDRTGTLWEGRFYSSAITSERCFLLCQRYIELNPVRAGIVLRAQDFAWSSHAHNALGQPNPLLVEHEIYCRLGGSRQARCEAYRQLFGVPLDKQDLSAIRTAIRTRGCLADPADAPPVKRRGRPRRPMQKPEAGDDQLEIRL
jgi:putative transposase